MTLQSIARLLVCASLAGCALNPDNVPSQLGAPCAVGIGACRAEGVLVANPSGQGVTCSATPGQPGPGEICDLGSEDENCNGLINEGCNCIPGLSPDRPCGSNQGQCRSGWQRCVDGSYAGECVGAVAPSTETCDGVDNDCNGIVDDVTGGCPGMGCQISTIATSGDAALEVSTDVAPCGPGSCFVDGTAAVMSFCCQPGSWTQCRFEEPVDLDRFDADHEGHGVLELEFCLSERMSGAALSFYYGTYPYRKGLSLLSDAERSTGLGPGCYVRYFSPQDAQCAAYDPNQLPSPDFPVACAHAGAGPLWPCPGGRWSALDERCGAAPFDYKAVPFWVTAEFCDGPASAAVSIRSIRLLDDACKCAVGADCARYAAGSCVAANVTASFCPATQPRCAGVCSDLDVPPAP